MPRDGAGNYTLPGGNPVVTGTIITSTWANPTMADIGNEIGNSLSRDGQGGMRVPLLFADGTRNDPGITFVTEPTLGIYRDTTSILGIVGVGIDIALFNGLTGDVTVNNQVVVGAAAPIEDAELTRKDYVDAIVGDSIQAIFDALYPVGSHKIGGDPNSIIPGTWVQLDEGTFLMNTVAGADTSGGSNDAVAVDHGHAVTDPGHGHAVTDPGHVHTMQSNEDNNANGSTNANCTRTPSATVTTNSNVTGISIVDNTTGLTVNDLTGEDGTDKNKPLYVGVEVWERTA